MNLAPQGSCVPKKYGGATEAQCKSEAAAAMEDQGTAKMKEACENEDVAPPCEWMLRV